MKKVTNTPAAFKWNEETYTQAATLYAELLGGTFDGKAIVMENKPSAEVHAAANNAGLDEIASQIGAKSGRAIRGKLAKEGVYISLEAAPTAKTSGRLSKVQYVRSMAKGLDMSEDTLSSLDKANTEALEALTKRVSELLVASGGSAIEVK